MEMDRNELLSTYAEYLLSPAIPASPEKAEGGMSAEELELRKRTEERLQQELELKRQKEERLQREEERLQREEERRKQEREEDLDGVEETGTRVPESETGEGRSAERRRLGSTEAAR